MGSLLKYSGRFFAFFYILYFARHAIDAKLFELTNDWQEISDDYSVPSGPINVKMDLKTGKKFARLDPNYVDSSEKSVQALPSQDIIKKDDKLVVKKKFKTSAELKRDFYDLNIIPESEQAFILRVLKSIRDANLPLEDRLTQLEKIQESLHGYDSANRFVEDGGLPILFDLLMINSQLSCELVMDSLFAILQNNDHTQEKFDRAKGLEVMGRMLKTSEPHRNCLVKSARTLSASIRGCTDCFHRLVSENAELFKFFLNQKDPRIKSKIYSLLTDVYKGSVSPLRTSENYLKELFKTHYLCSENKEYFELPSDFEPPTQLKDEIIKMLTDICNINEF